jgi:hypothetical protein
MTARDALADLLGRVADESKITMTLGACDSCGRRRWLTGARPACAACHVMTSRIDAESAVRLAAADLACRLNGSP